MAATSELLFFAVLPPPAVAERISRLTRALQRRLAISGNLRPAALLHITPPTIYRWLAQGKAHGIKTAGGQHRLCHRSLLRT